MKNDSKKTKNTKSKMNTCKLNALKLEALRVSQNSCVNFQHGCLIVRNGRIVSSACNNEYGHAEYNAVKNLQRLL